MKKLLCLVLTLALALVSVAALAEGAGNTSNASGSASAPSSKATTIEITITVEENSDSHTEQNDSHTEQNDSHTEQNDSHTEQNDSHTEQNDSHTEANDSSSTTTITINDDHSITVSGDGNAVSTGEGTATAETTGDTIENEKSYNGATKGASDKKSGGSGSKKSSSGTKGSSATGAATDVGAGIEIIIVDDTAETLALKNEFAAAIKAGDPKTALPENVASKLSADLKTVNEFVTAKLVGDVSNIASATVNVKFPTKYATSDKAVVLFGIPAGGSTNWITVNGVIESDGSITMVLNSSVLDALVGKTFAMIVLSK